MKHQFLQIDYDTSMKLKVNHCLEHDHEIYFFIFDEFLNKKEQANNVVYFSDFSGKIFRMNKNWSVESMQ